MPKGMNFNLNTQNSNSKVTSMHNHSKNKQNNDTGEEVKQPVIAQEEIIPFFREVNQDTFNNGMKMASIEKYANDYSKVSEACFFELQKIRAIFEKFTTFGSSSKNYYFNYRTAEEEEHNRKIKEDKEFSKNNEEIIGVRQYINATHIHTKVDVNAYDHREKIKNNISRLNALILFNYEIAQTYGSNATFLNFHFEDKTDYNKKTQSLTGYFEYHFDISIEGLSEYLFETTYQRYAKLSRTQSGSNKPYYFYDVTNYNWDMVNTDYISNVLSAHIKDLLKLLGVPKSTKIYPQIVKNIFHSFGRLVDTKGDMLYLYSKKYPNLVQFHDVVYDMDTDKFAIMSDKFMLLHHHDYRIPTGYENYLEDNSQRELLAEQGFIDLNITDDELREKCSKLLERLSILHYDDDIEFILTVIGSLFRHDNSWQVAPIIVGGGALGKSMIYNEIIGVNAVGSSNFSTLGQDEIDNGSDFLVSTLYGKELNLVTETNGSYLSPKFLVTFKRFGDNRDINKKFKEPFQASITAPTIMLGNTGQIPGIPSSYSNDEGLRRRIFIVNCRDKSYKVKFQEEHGMTIREYFKMDELIAEVPYFTLLCIRTFMKNLYNGNISKLDDVYGATEKVIKGFTNERIVKNTQDYFKSHNRNREFIVWLAEEFTSHPDASSDKTIDTFKEWLTMLPTKEIKSMYLWWFKDKYTSVTPKEQDLEEYLKNTLDVQSESGVTVVNGTQKRLKRYGKRFADIVVDIVNEDNPELLTFDEGLIESKLYEKRNDLNFDYN